MSNETTPSGLGYGMGWCSLRPCERRQRACCQARLAGSVQALSDCRQLDSIHQTQAPWCFVGSTSPCPASTGATAIAAMALSLLGES